MNSSISWHQTPCELCTSRQIDCSFEALHHRSRAVFASSSVVYHPFTGCSLFPCACPCEYQSGCSPCSCIFCSRFEAKWPFSASLVLGRGSSRIGKRSLRNKSSKIKLATYLARFTESFHALSTAAILHDESRCSHRVDRGSGSWSDCAFVVFIIAQSVVEVAFDVLLELVRIVLVVCVYLTVRACPIERRGLQLGRRICPFIVTVRR